MSFTVPQESLIELSMEYKIPGIKKEKKVVTHYLFLFKKQKETKCSVLLPGGSRYIFIPEGKTFKQFLQEISFQNRQKGIRDENFSLQQLFQNDQSWFESSTKNGGEDSQNERISLVLLAKFGFTPQLFHDLKDIRDGFLQLTPETLCSVFATEFFDRIRILQDPAILWRIERVKISNQIFHEKSLNVEELRIPTEKISYVYNEKVPQRQNPMMFIPKRVFAMKKPLMISAFFMKKEGFTFETPRKMYFYGLRPQTRQILAQNNVLLDFQRKLVEGLKVEDSLVFFPVFERDKFFTRCLKATSRIGIKKEKKKFKKKQNNKQYDS